MNSANDFLSLPPAQTKHLEEIRRFLGVDRVCLYRFASDGSGQVVGESVEGTALPSLLHLHFPAEDIPERARSRFHQERMRVIVDTTTAYLARQNPGNNYIRDYEQADPCHIQYLKNLGVQAGMTIPIVVREHL